MNNRKQKVKSFLNSITSKELEDYIKENNIPNKNIQEMIDRIKHHRPEKHLDIITSKINDGLGKDINSIYKSGQAWVIAFVFRMFYNDKYKVSDLQEYMKAMMESDEELKEYVYEIMKDF